MDGGTLGGIISEMVLGALDETRDGSDVENGSGVAVLVLRRLLQQWQEGRAKEEDLADVRAVDLLPHLETLVLGIEDVSSYLFGAVAFRLVRGACDTGVVDEHAEALLPLFEVGDETPDIILLGDVGGEGDDLARNALAVGLGHAFELLFRTAYDVDYRDG